MPDPEDEINMSTQVYYAGYQGGVLVYSTNGKWLYGQTDRDWIPHPRPKG